MNTTQKIYCQSMNLNIKLHTLLGLDLPLHLYIQKYYFEENWIMHIPPFPINFKYVVGVDYNEGEEWWWIYLKLFCCDYAGTVGGSSGGGVRTNRRISLQKPRLGAPHVWRRVDRGAFSRATVLRLWAFLQATSLRLLVVVKHVLVVRLGEEEVLGRDEEGGDGVNAVLELLEGVYTVAKAVLNGNVGSWKFFCEVHGEAFDGLVHHWVAWVRMGGPEAARLFILSLFLSEFEIYFGGLLWNNIEIAHTKSLQYSYPPGGGINSTGWKMC